MSIEDINNKLLELQKELVEVKKDRDYWKEAFYKETRERSEQNIKIKTSLGLYEPEMGG